MDISAASPEGASLLARPTNTTLNASQTSVASFRVTDRRLQSNEEVDAPDGSIILEHLSAVCLHHGSSAATGATGK
ncbi:hypothetical protein EYF80_023428 [Liparis tanakae]|uniref:Uncharacterized protein n=1 Tax=Liparis tanakae TaxID=230148 RepID=A0A4Z2HKJ4_9TELE|nr:hypothetical protein EYF80_023428 [Liparis tanakae]